MEHFFSPNSGEDQNQKKSSSPQMEHFFPPNSSGHLRSDAHQSQIIGRDADVDHTQTIGGYSQIIGGVYITPIPPGFGTHVYVFVNHSNWLKLCVLWCLVIAPFSNVYRTIFLFVCK